MKKYHKFKFISSILGLIVLSASSLLLSKYSNNIEETFAQTTPTNVNVTDLTDAQVNSYYAGVENKSGDQLLSALYTIIDGHREYSYESTSDRYVYKIIDRNWTLSPLSSAQLSNFDYAGNNPFIRKFYADYNDSASTADLFINSGASRVSFDKEHLWAQSMGNFGRTGGAGSDFHSLVPGDIIGNQNMHSNYNYATPQTSISTYVGDEYNGTDKTIPDRSTYVGRNGYISGSSQKVCEPLDEYKGDVARAMFYMPARYYEYIDVLHPKLTLVNGSPLAVTASPTQPGLAGDLATLLLWNELDPVDEYEIHRNNLIYNNYQLNRNPFIDHPEWARIAFDTSYSGPGASTAAGTSSVGDGGETVLVTDINLDNSTLTMGVGSQHTLTATVLPINATNKTLNWSSTNQSVATVSNGVISTVSAGTATITATATDGSAVDESCSLTVTAEAQKILEYIQVSGATATAAYGSTYNTSPIVVTAYYDDLSSENVTSSSTINLPNTSVLGLQTATITYAGKTTSYTVTITNNGASVSTSANFATDLFISEYIEASSGNDKLLEIYNGTGTTVSLDGYSINLYSNGSSTASSTYSFSSSASLTNDSVFSIVNAGAAAAYKVGTYVESVVTYFNGNDAIALLKNGVIIDLIGVIGVDPDGGAWNGTAANGSGSTANMTLRRTSNINSPNTTFTMGEWNAYANQQSSDVGIHTFIGGEVTGDVTSDEQAIAWATYFLDLTDETCQAMSGAFESDWITLASEYDFMAVSSKDAFVNNAPSNANISAAIERYQYIVNKYQLDNFVTDGNSVEMTAVESRLTLNNSLDDWHIIVAITIILSSTLLIFLFVEKRKRSLQ